MTTNTPSDDCPDLCQKLEFCVDKARLSPEEIEALQAALSSAYRAGLDAALTDIVAEEVSLDDDFDIEAWLDNFEFEDELTLPELADYVLEIEDDLDTAFETRDAIHNSLLENLQEVFNDIGAEIDAVGNFALEVKATCDADAAYTEALDGKLGDLATLVADLSSRVRHLESGPLV